MKEGKTRIGKVFTLCEKRSAGKIKGEISRKSPEVGSKTRQDEKKVGFTRKKTSAIPRKVPEIESKRGKSGKNGDFGVKKVGWGSDEKTGFTADFARL